MLPDDPDDDPPVDDAVPAIDGGWWVVDAATRDALRADALDAALRHGDLARVVIELEEHLDRSPADLDALRLLAAVETARRDALTARAAWQAVIAHGGDTPDAFVQLALAAYDAADLEGARAAASRAVSLDRRAAEAWYTLALLAAHDGDDLAAWRLHRTAFELHPAACPLPLPLPRPRDVVKEAFRRAPSAVRRAWSRVPVAMERFPSADDLHTTVPPLSPRTLVLFDGDPATDTRPRGLRVFVGNLAHHDDEDGAADALSAGLLDEFEAWTDARPRADATP